MLQPKWVLELKKEVVRKRVITMLIGVILSVIAAIVGWCLEPKHLEVGFIVGGIALGVFLPFGGILALGIKIRIRHYNGNVICLYSGILHGRLFINGELVDEGGMFDWNYYGQLPTGEEVVAKMTTGGFTFYIGNATNNQGVHMS